MPGPGGWEEVGSLTQRILDGLGFPPLLRGTDPHSHTQAPILVITVLYSGPP